MQIGDLVRVKWMNPTSKDTNVGVIIKLLKHWQSEFAKVALPNGYIATYRISNLEVICK